MTREAEILESAIAVVEAVLRLPVLERHKRDIVNGMLWSITQARGKYRTRFRSKASLESSGVKLHHEHVFTRKDLIDRIMAKPEEARQILSEAVACVVTVDEHRRLSRVERERPELRGWDRYTAAQIEWVDTDDAS